MKTLKDGQTILLLSDGLPKLGDAVKVEVGEGLLFSLQGCMRLIQVRQLE